MCFCRRSSAKEFQTVLQPLYAVKSTSGRCCPYDIMSNLLQYCQLTLMKSAAISQLPNHTACGIHCRSLIGTERYMVRGWTRLNCCADRTRKVMEECAAWRVRFGGRARNPDAAINSTTSALGGWADIRDTTAVREASS